MPPSSTYARWCEIQVRIDGGKGGPIESEAFRISFNRESPWLHASATPCSKSVSAPLTCIGCGGNPYLTVSDREDADHFREYPVRFTDIDLFDHMKNAAPWSVVEDYLSSHPEPLRAPPQVTSLEHEAPIALGDKLEILAHTHPAGSTDRFGAELGAPHGEHAHFARRRNQSYRLALRPWPRTPIEHTPSD